MTVKLQLVPKPSLQMKGVVGFKGDKGDANTLAVGTVTTGAPGTNAAVSITGDAPNQAISFTIPRGDTGAPNSLSIGTVTTGAPGSSADAQITGDAPSQTLNLTIPEGERGMYGGAAAAKYTFSTDTTTTGLSSGQLRFNSVSQIGATQIYLSSTSADGKSFGSVIDTFDDSTSTVKGYIRLTSEASTAQLVYAVTGSVVLGPGRRTLTISNVSYSGVALTNGESLILAFSRTGDKGADGVSDGDKGDVTVSSSGTVWTVKSTAPAIDAKIDKTSISTATNGTSDTKVASESALKAAYDLAAAALPKTSASTTDLTVAPTGGAVFKVGGSGDGAGALHGDDGQTGHGYRIKARPDASLVFPVPSFQPTTANTVLALDLMPKGSPSESSGNGYTWLDVCDADLIANPSAPVKYARVSMRSTGAVFSAGSYNGATAPNLYLEAGATLRWVVGASNGVFGPVVDNAYSLGASGFRPSVLWAATGTISTSDETMKDRLQQPVPGLSFVRDVAASAAMMYRWKVGGNDIGENCQPVPRPGIRIHAGFGAQTFKSIMDQHGVDFGAYVEAEDGTKGLRMEQLIPSLYIALSQLADIVDRQAEEIAELKAHLN